MCIKLTVEAGELRLCKLKLPFLKSVSCVIADGRNIPFVFSDAAVSFDATIKTELTVVC